MQRGYIKIWRKLEDSGLLQMPNTLCLFMVMLMKAVYKPCKVGMAELTRGQLSAGVHQLCGWTGLSTQNVRTSLNHMHKLNIITSKSTNKYTIYTFVNYNEYQDIDVPPNKLPTNDQQTGNKQLTTEEDINTLSIKKESNTMSLPATQKADSVPYEQIKDLYHQTLPMCPKVVMLTGKRKGQIAARWKSGVLPDLDSWKQYFEFVSNSDFLTGKTDPINGHKRFVANLEWLTNESNFVKTWENKYHR